jgi:hypothetical protein
MRQERVRTAARVNYLESLVGREDELWQRVKTLVATRRQSDYDQAVLVIRDLRDAASRTGQIDTFVSRLEQAAILSAQQLAPRDQVGILTFDSFQHWILPMTGVLGLGPTAITDRPLEADGGPTSFQPYRWLSTPSARPMLATST